MKKAKEETATIAFRAKVSLKKDLEKLSEKEHRTVSHQIIYLLERALYPASKHLQESE